MYMKICFYGGASKEIKPEYTEEAYKLGEEQLKEVMNQFLVGEKME